MSKVRVRPETGKLYFDFQHHGVRCREYSTLDDTAANRRKMEAALRKIDAQIEAGTFEYAQHFAGSKNLPRVQQAIAAREVSATECLRPSHDAPAASNATSFPRFSDFSQQWLIEKRVEWRRTYIDTVEGSLTAHLLPQFGALELNQIDRAAVLAYRAKLSTTTENTRNGNPKLSASTVNRIMGILRMILQEASIRHGLQNPCLGVKRLKQQRSDIEPLTIEQVRTLIATVRPDYRDYLTVRFFTGMRSGEAHGLKWSCVDFERREILIRETFTHGQTEYTKTDGSQRAIQMSQWVHDALKRQHAVTSPHTDYVFSTRSCGPIDNKNFDARVWRPLLRLLGYANRRPYQMRHTCATLWLAAGENPEWIARQLGHTTTEMLFRVYSRYIPNLTRRDGSAFDSLVSTAMHGGLATETQAPLATNAPQEVRHGE